MKGCIGTYYAVVATDDEQYPLAVVKVKTRDTMEGWETIQTTVAVIPKGQEHEAVAVTKFLSAT